MWKSSWASGRLVLECEKLVDGLVGQPALHGDTQRALALWDASLHIHLAFSLPTCNLHPTCPSNLGLFLISMQGKAIREHLLMPSSYTTDFTKLFHRFLEPSICPRISMNISSISIFRNFTLLECENWRGGKWNMVNSK